MKTQTSKKTTQAPVALETGTKNTTILAWVLGILSFGIYLNTIKHGFVLDDIAVIEQNKFVTQGIGGIPKIMSTFYWEGYWNLNSGLYRPLSLVMFSIEWAISPGNPLIHHFMNVLLYAFSIVLLYRLLKKLFSDFSAWVPFVIVLLFAVHPIHTEVVANIKSRDEILCFFFFLLTFLEILKEKANWSSRLKIAAYFFLCLLSKEAGILFLPVIALYFVLLKKETVKAMFLRAVPMIISGALWLVLHQSVIRSSAHDRIMYTYHDNSLVACGDKANQMATGIELAGKYLEKSIAPINLTYDYSFSDIPCSSFASVSVWSILAVFAALIAIGGYFRKKHPFLLFGILFFVITIALACNVLMLIGTTFGERLLYAPVLGMLIFVVIGLHAFLKSEQSKAFLNPVSGVLVLVALVSVGCTWIRNKDWESNNTLFEAAVKVPTNSSRVFANHATVLMNIESTDSIARRQTTSSAIHYFEKALKIDAGNKEAEINVAVCYYRIGNYKQSINHTKNALKLEPKDTLIYANLADAYFQMKELDSAVVWYEKELKSTFTKAGDFERLGTIYFQRQQMDDAIRVYKIGVKRFPDFENLHMSLGNCYGITEKYDDAIRVFKAVYDKNPYNKNALNMLIMTYARKGDTENAEKYKAIAAGPATQPAPPESAQPSTPPSN